MGLPTCPLQIVVAPNIAVGIAGAFDEAVTAFQLCELEPQELLATTQIFEIDFIPIRIFVPNSQFS